MPSGGDVRRREVLESEKPGGIAMLTEIVSGAKAWTGATLQPDSWIVPIPGPCRDELDRALAMLRAHPLPLFLLKPGDFARRLPRADGRGAGEA